MTDLKPGMSATATMTTTTTVTPVTVTEVKSRTVAGVRVQRVRAGPGRIATVHAQRTGQALNQKSSWTPSLARCPNFMRATSRQRRSSPASRPRSSRRRKCRRRSPRPAARHPLRPRLRRPPQPPRELRPQTAAPAQQPVSTIKHRLPGTAGSLPTIGSISLASVAAGALATRRRRAR